MKKTISLCIIPVIICTCLCTHKKPAQEYLTLHHKNDKFLEIPLVCSPESGSRKIYASEFTGVKIEKIAADETVIKAEKIDIYPFTLNHSMYLIL